VNLLELIEWGFEDAEQTEEQENIINL